MKPDRTKTGKQFSTFVAFYCAVFSSVILGQVFIDGHNPVHITNADLIIPAVSGLFFVLVISRQKTIKRTLL